MNKINKKYLLVSLVFILFLRVFIIIIFWKKDNNFNTTQINNIPDQSQFSWLNSYSLDKENIKYYSKQTSSGMILESRRVLLNYLKVNDYKDINEFYKNLDNIKLFLTINKISYTSQDIIDIINGYFYELSDNNLCSLYESDKNNFKKYDNYSKILEKNCIKNLLK